MTELRICRHNGLSSEQERALAKRLLKNALAERLPHRPVQFQLEYGKYGKPYLGYALLRYPTVRLELTLNDCALQNYTLQIVVLPIPKTIISIKIRNCLINGFTNCGHKKRHI